MIWRWMSNEKLLLSLLIGWVVLRWLSDGKLPPLLIDCHALSWCSRSNGRPSPAVLSNQWPRLLLSISRWKRDGAPPPWRWVSPPTCFARRLRTRTSKSAQGYSV